VKAPINAGYICNVASLNIAIFSFYLDEVIVTRNCSIPDGKKLFFPIINNVIFDTPNICGQDNNNLSYEDMVASVKEQTDAATGMKVTLDGREVRNIKRIRPRATSEACHFLQGESPCLEFKGMNS
jgi:hypothetical protein